MFLGHGGNHVSPVDPLLCRRVSHFAVRLPPGEVRLRRTFAGHRGALECRRLAAKGLLLASLAPMAATDTMHEVRCPHCKKTFQGQLLGGVAARHHGFKCRYCKLFVPLNRVELDQPAA